MNLKPISMQTLRLGGSRPRSGGVCHQPTSSHQTVLLVDFHLRSLHLTSTTSGLKSSANRSSSPSFSSPSPIISITSTNTVSTTSNLFNLFNKSMATGNEADAMKKEIENRKKNARAKAFKNKPTTAVAIDHPSNPGAKKFIEDNCRMIDCSSDALLDPQWLYRVALVLERPPVVTAYHPGWMIRWKSFLLEHQRMKAKVVPKDLQQFIFDGLKDQESVNDESDVMPRITEDDYNENRQSINRQLDKRVYFLCKKPRDGEHAWHFPEADWLGVHPLRRTIQEACPALLGENCRFFLLGNSPIGHIKYKYPAPRGRYIGAKVFYYHAWHLGGDTQFNSTYYTDQAWVTKEELKEFLSPQVLTLCNDMIVDDY